MFTYSCLSAVRSLGCNFNNKHLIAPCYVLSQVIFNGNGYDQESQKELTAKGLCRIDSGVDAMCRFTDPKNVKLFKDLKVTNNNLVSITRYLLLNFSYSYCRC